MIYLKRRREDINYTIIGKQAVVRWLSLFILFAAQNFFRSSIRNNKKTQPSKLNLFLIDLGKSVYFIFQSLQSIAIGVHFVHVLTVVGQFCVGYLKLGWMIPTNLAYLPSIILADRPSPVIDWPHFLFSL